MFLMCSAGHGRGRELKVSGVGRQGWWGCSSLMGHSVPLVLCSPARGVWWGRWWGLVFLRQRVVGSEWLGIVVSHLGTDSGGWVWAQVSG